MYSTCRDTCPVTATTIRGALDEVGHDVPALAVSVDPENDTPDNAESFLVKQRLSGGRMRFLMGSRAQLAPVWTPGIQPQGKGFEHSAYVLLIDKAGRQRVELPGRAADRPRARARHRRLERGLGSSPRRSRAGARAARRYTARRRRSPPGRGRAASGTSGRRGRGITAPPPTGATGPRLVKPTITASIQYCERVAARGSS